MFAVINAGGKQYKVVKNDVFSVEKMKVRSGAEIKLDKVLLIKEGNSTHIGSPYLKGSRVICEVLRQEREAKVTAFKYKKRKSEKKKIGHRRDVTVLKVKEIEISKGDK